MDDEYMGGTPENGDNDSDILNENNNAPVNNEPDDNAEQSGAETGSNDYYSPVKNNETTGNGMGNNQYGNNSYGNNQYGNNPYANNQYGNNQYGSNPYGNNQYGNNQYGNGQPFNNPYGNNQPSGPAPVRPPKKKMDKGAKAFIIIIVAIVLFAIAVMVGIFVRGGSDSTKPGQESVSGSSESDGIDNVESISSSDGSLAAGEAAQVAEIAQKYNVGILVYANDSLYTEGSGVIIKEDSDGKYTYIMTCAHVINYNGVTISVLMEDGTEVKAETVGLDTRTDIGVLRIEKSGLKCAEFASSENLIVGQTVYAVGNPGGSEFFGSVTNGIISAIDRPISSNTGYEMECIQHTAAINPGNSGGALVNGEGKVIGINSMKIASTEYEGMGFAVPSEIALKVFNSIIENGYVAGRAKLGISYSSPSAYSQTIAMYVQMKGLPSGTIVIAQIADGSSFAGTDVKVGDLITKVNGKDMTDTGMLSDMIEDMSVGDSLTLTIVRVDTNAWTQTESNVKVTLVEDKGTTATAETTTQSSSSNPFGSSGDSSYGDLYDYFKKYYGY